jgi:hypothetical protein
MNRNKTEQKWYLEVYDSNGMLIQHTIEIFCDCHDVRKNMKEIRNDLFKSYIKNSKKLSPNSWSVIARFDDNKIFFEKLGNPPSDKIVKGSNSNSAGYMYVMNSIDLDDWS